MRTTLNFPEDLLQEARTLLRFQSKTDTVIAALEELIRRKKIDELKGQAGKVDLQVDLARSRRRPSARSKG
jgi:hypothetical protein